MRLAVVVLSTLVALAGCVTPPEDAATATSAATERGPFVDPIVDDHDHASFADHDASTPNMHLVGHTPMGEDGKPYSYIGEMDTYGNLTVVQVLGRGSTPGFVVIDTSDPSSPTPIGRADMPWSYVVDVKWSPDGKYVFAASQQRPSPDPSDPFLSTVQGYGFTQWDMSDPTTPVAVAGGVAAPTGCHMLSVKELGGQLTVFCVAAGAVQIFRYAEAGAWTQAGAITPGASGAGAERVVGEAVAAGPNAPFAAALGVGPHDITIQEDPLEEGRFIASISYWDQGLRFYDVTDPLRPVELGALALGAWAGEGATNYEGNVHSAVLYGHHGEQRLAIVGPELLGDTHPALWILDVTDFGAPKLVGEWHPPGEHSTQGLLLTTHQFQVVAEKIYLAYNHAGVWVLDIHAIMKGEYASDTARPDVLGYYLPHEEVELYDADTAAVPNTWDVNVKDGYIFASDRYTGFYVLHYAGDAMGDPAVTSAT